MSVLFTRQTLQLSFILLTNQTTSLMVLRLWPASLHRHISPRGGASRKPHPNRLWVTEVDEMIQKIWYAHELFFFFFNNKNNQFNSQSFSFCSVVVTLSLVWPIRKTAVEVWVIPGAKINVTNALYYLVSSIIFYYITWLFFGSCILLSLPKIKVCYKPKTTLSHFPFFKKKFISPSHYFSFFFFKFTLGMCHCSLGVTFQNGPEGKSSPPPTPILSS